MYTDNRSNLKTIDTAKCHISVKKRSYLKIMFSINYENKRVLQK